MPQACSDDCADNHVDQHVPDKVGVLSVASRLHTGEHSAGNCAKHQSDSVEMDGVSEFADMNCDT